MLPNPRLTDPHGRGVSVAAIEVVVNTDVPAVIDATVSILADGVSRPLPPVPVSGRIMAPVEVSPRSLMLPIASSGGPIKEATCLFRSSNGKSFDLRLESAPPGFDVEIQPLTAEAKSIRVVRIRLKEHASKREGGSRVVIRFRTSQNSADSRIELPVMVNGGDK
jgi:hypothetical protein